MAASADAPPRCRLDDRDAALVGRTLKGAAAGYAALGRPLPFDDVAVNPTTPAHGERVLRVFVVKDAAKDGTSKDGCAKAAPGRDDVLDERSVRGGCVVTAADRLELRCSSAAVRVFGEMKGRPDRANPALLYVLAHELGHISQGRLGEYAGRLERIDLAKPADEKLNQLRSSCEPANVKLEAAADAMSIEVLKALVPKPPYREPAFSEQGSVYWAVDQLYLAANAWQSAAMTREFMSQPKPHASFIATEFPTPPPVIDSNARKFVCDVLTQKKGVVLYPLRAIDHPPLEQRMRAVAEALKPIAAKLPKSDGTQQFQSIAVLQEQLSPIFATLYRANGVYLESLRRNICTRVNGETPVAECR
ncbi:hypothetical protein QTH97_26360 [Variovorax sp. J22R24]|uniref:hypothetical protein n=1 Tax=Variovorax gracilis TaxID=3053502 RepID=UPI0025781B2F|nr:hypothetical protein [Variovorax sp. J22R24]MDM0108499.1 hypothetical protein [Variovorax sp. J22R24]